MLRRVEYNQVADIDREVFGHYYVGEDVVWWASLIGGRVAYYCGLDLLEDESAGFLCRAWVSPRRRGLGLHRKMVKVRERAARETGCDRIITYTANHNVKSANTLIRCGYRTYIPANGWGINGCNYWFKLLEG